MVFIILSPGGSGLKWFCLKSGGAGLKKKLASGQVKFPGYPVYLENQMETQAWSLLDFTSLHRETLDTKNMHVRGFQR